MAHHFGGCSTIIVSCIQFYTLVRPACVLSGSKFGYIHQLYPLQGLATTAFSPIVWTGNLLFDKNPSQNYRGKVHTYFFSCWYLCDAFADVRKKYLVVFTKSDEFIHLVAFCLVSCSFLYLVLSVASSFKRPKVNISYSKI